MKYRTSILAQLEHGPSTIQELIKACEVAYGGLMPAASMRRIIQRLRKNGDNIVATLSHSRNSRYTLVRAEGTGAYDWAV